MPRRVITNLTFFPPVERLAVRVAREVRMCADRREHTDKIIVRSNYTCLVSDFAVVSEIPRDEGDTEPRFHRNSTAGNEFQLGLVSPAVS